MNTPSTTRRTVLRTGAAALTTAAVAGCLGDGSGDGPGDDSGGSPAPVDHAPADSRYVLHADAASLLSDDVLRERTNELLGAASQESLSVETLLSQAESQTGLDPEKLQTVTLSGTYEQSAAVAVRIESEWSESAVSEALAGDSAVPTAESYEGETVYRYENENTLGVLGEGAFVVGHNGGVEGAIDVATGSAESLSGTVSEGFASAPPGAVRFAFETPEDYGEDQSTTESPLDPESVASVTHGYGGYVVDGDSRRASMTLATEAADDATQLADGLQTLLQQVRTQMNESQQFQAALASPVRELIESTSISADGAAVVITSEEAEALPVVLGAVFGSFVLGLGSSQRSPPMPQVSFGFDYDADAGVLEVTHEAGDHARADQLFLRGDGLTSAEGTDMSGPGQWAGTASGTTDGQPAVVAGDSVTVGFEADGVCSVVWESADTDMSAELASFQGPEA